MADANVNNPAPEENQPQLPLEGQEPLITSDPEAAKKEAEKEAAEAGAPAEVVELAGQVRAAETARQKASKTFEMEPDPEAERIGQHREEGVYESTKGTLSTGEVDESIQTIRAAGPMQQLEAEKEAPSTGATPPPLHDSPAYKAQQAKKKEAADAIFDEADAERAAFEAEDAQKVAEAMERKGGKMPEELAEMTNEKIETWLGKHDAELKQGLVEMFKLSPEDAMTDQELAQFENELTPEKLQDPELLFARWFNRLEAEGKKLPVDEKVAADVLTHVIQKDLPPTAPQ